MRRNKEFAWRMATLRISNGWRLWPICNLESIGGKTFCGCSRTMWGMQPCWWQTMGRWESTNRVGDPQWENKEALYRYILLRILKCCYILRTFDVKFVDGSLWLYTGLNYTFCESVCDGRLIKPKQLLKGILFLFFKAILSIFPKWKQQ